MPTRDVAARAAESVTRRESDRAVEVVRMKAAGLSFSEIGVRFGITRQRAHQAFWDEIRRVADEHRQVSDLVFFEVLEREHLVVRSEAEKLLKPCHGCAGRERDVASCGRCKGSGYHYSATVRTEAARTIQRSNDMIAKLHGLYAPERRQVVVDSSFRDDLAKLTDDELEAEIAGYMKALDPWGITGVDE